LYGIISNPQVYKALQRALDESFSNPFGPLDNNKLEEIPYLTAVINEALRLGTPFYVPRIVPEREGGVVIDGRAVPSGTIVALAAYSQQVAEENFWPEPMVGSSNMRWLPYNNVIFVNIDFQT
jgi:cytochrome P450